MPKLTVFCDASLCPKTGAAGWGAWYKHDHMQAGQLIGGAFKDRHTSSEESELCAIANALIHIAKAGDVPDPLDLLLIQSDSTRALELIRGRYPQVGAANPVGQKDVALNKSSTVKTANQERALLIVGKFITAMQPANVFVRHVKGHQSGGGRSWVNRKCDDIAGNHMREVRVRLGQP